MEKSKNIYQKINAAMGKVSYVQKENSNVSMKYKYASHDAVVSLVRKAVQEEGIVIIPAIESYGLVGNMLMMQLKVSIVNMDEPSDQIVMNFAVPSTARNGVADEKSFGATYSYALKYALLKTFMIETGEDADSIDSEPKPPKLKEPKEEIQKVPKITREQAEEIARLANQNPEQMSKCFKALNIYKIEDIPLEVGQKIIQSFYKVPVAVAA